MSRERLWKQRERFADLDPAQVHREGAPIPRPTQLAFGDLGINLRDVTFVVVDLETTGGRPGEELNYGNRRGEDSRRGNPRRVLNADQSRGTDPRAHYDAHRDLNLDDLRCPADCGGSTEIY